MAAEARERRQKLGRRQRREQRRERNRALGNDGPWKRLRRRHMSRGRRLDDDEDLSFLEGEVLDVPSMWSYLNGVLGPALFGQTKDCRVAGGNDAAGCGVYLLDAHRLIGAVRIEQLRINEVRARPPVAPAAPPRRCRSPRRSPPPRRSSSPRVSTTGSRWPSSRTLRTSTPTTWRRALLGSTVGDRGCAVPTVYSPKGGLLNDGQQSQIKIGACYPSEERVFATYNNTPYGTRNTTYHGFTTYRPEGASAAANTSAAFYPNASRADGLPRFHVDVPGNVNLTVWRSTMEELRLAGYVDPRTRVVDVHFNLYNPASQYFIAVRVSFRLAHTGGVWADAEFMPVHTLRHLLFFAGGAAESRTCLGSLNGNDVLLAVLEIFFLLMVVMVLFWRWRSSSSRSSRISSRRRTSSRSRPSASSSRSTRGASSPSARSRRRSTTTRGGSTRTRRRLSTSCSSAAAR